MGFNTTVVVMNDALHSIERDPEFGRKLADAVAQLAHAKKPVDVPALGHTNAATVVESHHADQTAIVTIGGNYGTLQAMSWGWTHHTPETAEAHLRAWARKLGFGIRKRSPSQGGSED